MKLRSVVGAGAAAGALMHGAPYVLTLAAYAPAKLRFMAQLRPLLYGMGRSGHVALTFDDGPDVAGTPVILDELDTLGWKATFFMLGKMTRRNPKVARAVVERGHEVALHGYAHDSFMKMALPAAIEDIGRARDAVEQITGVEVTHFRPPYGTLSAPALLAARIHKLDTVLWSSWGKDWQGAIMAAGIVKNIERGVLDGGTILLHDSDCTSSANSWQRTAAALPMLSEVISEKGLRVGPLREHFA